MKKFYLTLIIALLAISASYKGDAQTISNITFFDSCYSGTNLSLSLSSAGTGLSFVTYWGDGTSTTTTIPNNATWGWTTHGYTTQGAYTIKVILLSSGTPIDSSITSYTTDPCSAIEIGSYYDNNNNCIRDVTEPFIYSPIYYEVDSAGTVIDTITCMGYTYYKAKLPGGTYTFRVINPLLGTVTCPSSGTITVTAPPANNFTRIKFGFQCGSTSQFDLGVALVGRFRPVNTSTLVIYAYNNSCAAQNGVLTVHLSNKYTYQSANVTPSSINGNVITWNLSNLDILHSKVIYLYADTATTVTLNDTICNYATITPTSGDVYLPNNTANQCDGVRASWDPNDKHVHPAGNIPSGQELTYTINFENLGNDTAFNIHILDTLSQHLDPSTLQVISSSHAVATTLYDYSNTKVVKFDFANIYLPDSNSREYNKGFVQFKINVKPNRAPNQVITNRAGIYFDINPVILTNYTENTIAPVGIKNVSKANDVTMYPNPVSGVLTIRTANNAYHKAQVYNTLGQMVLEQSISNNTTQMNMQHLMPGIYYIQLQGTHETRVEKIEKK